MRGQRFGRVPCALAIAFLFGVTNAAADSVGTVTKVVNQAQIGSNTAVSRIPVYMNDRLRTGSDSRLQVTFRDNSVLTLGEKAMWSSTAMSLTLKKAKAKSC